MFDYESMSDLQINKLVAEKIGLIFRDDDLDYRSEYPSTLWCANHEFGNQIEPWEQKNFILTPDDAWPIIVENEISIQKDTTHCCEECSEYFTTDLWESDHPIIDRVSCFDSNPLRAAMIVFLKMKG